MSELIGSHHQVSPWESAVRPLWRWARGHPKAVVVGVLLLAGVLAAPLARKAPPPIDRAAEDVPLFI